MVANGIYFGFGFNVTKNELIEKFGLNHIKNKKKSPNDEINYYDVYRLTVDYLKNNPVLNKFEIIAFPHTYKEYKNNLYAIGMFTHITEFYNDDCKRKTVSELNAILNEKFDVKPIENIFEKNGSIMTILDDCHCCT